MPAARTHPGVYVAETSNSSRTIQGVATSITAFVGRTNRGPLNTPWTVGSLAEFEAEFGAADVSNTLAYAVDDFFANGGREALIVRVFRDNGAPEGLPPDKASYQAAFHALRQTDIFNLLCLPPDDTAGDVEIVALQAALALCVERRAFLVVDPRSEWRMPGDVLDANIGLATLGLSGAAARNAAVFFPRISKADSARSHQIANFVPCGAVAGMISRIDAQRGVWKASAGLEATLRGIQGLSVSLSNHETGKLNAAGVCCLRDLPGVGPVVWGARTLRGYVPTLARCIPSLVSVPGGYQNSSDMPLG